MHSIIIDSHLVVQQNQSGNCSLLFSGPGSRYVTKIDLSSEVSLEDLKNLRFSDQDRKDIVSFARRVQKMASPHFKGVRPENVTFSSQEREALVCIQDKEITTVFDSNESAAQVRALIKKVHDLVNRNIRPLELQQSKPEARPVDSLEYDSQVLPASNIQPLELQQSKSEARPVGSLRHRSQVFPIFVEASKQVQQTAFPDLHWGHLLHKGYDNYQGADPRAFIGEGIRQLLNAELAGIDAEGEEAAVAFHWLASTLSILREENSCSELEINTYFLLYLHGRADFNPPSQKAPDAHRSLMEKLRTQKTLYGEVEIEQKVENLKKKSNPSFTTTWKHVIAIQERSGELVQNLCLEQRFKEAKATLTLANFLIKELQEQQSLNHLTLSDIKKIFPQQEYHPALEAFFGSAMGELFTKFQAASHKVSSMFSGDDDLSSITWEKLNTEKGAKTFFASLRDNEDTLNLSTWLYALIEELLQNFRVSKEEIKSYLLYFMPGEESQKREGIKNIFDTLFISDNFSEVDSLFDFSE